jgi:hypothetical protein
MSAERMPITAAPIPTPIPTFAPLWRLEDFGRDVPGLIVEFAGGDTGIVELLAVNVGCVILFGFKMLR